MAQCVVQPYPGSGTPASVSGLMSCLELSETGYIAGFSLGTAATSYLRSGAAGAWGPLIAVSPGAQGTRVHALLRLPDSSLVVAGHFSAIGGVPVRNLARSQGGSWVPLAAGTGIADPWARVHAVAIAANGDLLVGGNFPIVSGTATSWHVARWNGISWQPLGQGLDPLAPCHGLLAEPNGDVLVGGEAGVLRWNGSAWSPEGTGLSMGPVPFSGNAVTSLVRDHSGALIAHGTFYVGSSSNWTNLAHLSGTTWHAFPPLPVPGFVYAPALLPNGDFVVTVGSSLIRWNGSAWSVLATAPAPLGIPYFTPQGRVLTASSTWASQATAFAEFESTCAASALPGGTSCAGLVLTPKNLPWLGTTFEATGDGLGQNGIGLLLTGFQRPAIPLSLVHPAGNPLCLVHSSAVFSELVFAPLGRIVSRVTIPNDATLIGFTFGQQLLQLHPDPQFQLASITSSNHLRLQLGIY